MTRHALKIYWSIVLKKKVKLLLEHLPLFPPRRRNPRKRPLAKKNKRRNLYTTINMTQNAPM